MTELHPQVVSRMSPASASFERRIFVSIEPWFLHQKQFADRSKLSLADSLVSNLGVIECLFRHLRRSSG